MWVQASGVHGTYKSRGFGVQCFASRKRGGGLWRFLLVNFLDMT